MMYMLITVCESQIDTEIIKGLDVSQQTMLDSITKLYADADRLDRMENDKGDEWNMYDMTGWCSYEIAGSSYDYRIVELPSYVTDLI